jgi:hypothetical protein
MEVRPRSDNPARRGGVAGMTGHIPKFEDFDIPTTKKDYRITCSCGVIVTDRDPDRIWLHWQIHVHDHQITELTGRIEGSKS